MTLNLLRIPAFAALTAALLAIPALPQSSRPAEPASPYGGVTVEDILARVNDQIITRSDYDRAQKELDDEARKQGASMQQISDAHKDLLRNLIDQQLWLSKGKELGINGETDLINRLNEIRKQYNLASLEDLEKAAQEQGVSYEDFKANIRNQIITQQVMRDEVGRHISFTPGEVQRYYDEHKQEFVQPESVRLSEILVGTPADATDAQVAAAKAKADDLVAKAKAGSDFAQLAKSSSEGQTAAQGGDLGAYKRGQLAKIFEDATFDQKTGAVTEPIRTKQGFVIFKVVQHVSGGPQPYKDVEQQVEQEYYGSKMEPAIREYLTKMREDSYIDIAPGFTDTGASSNKRVNPIAYSKYTPPAPKKKKKVERTRFRENVHYRSKTTMPGAAPAATETSAAAAPASTKSAKADQTAQKPGKREKIRYGKAPTKTLPAGPETPTEDAGANPQVAQAAQPDNPVEQVPAPEKKTRYSDRAREPKQHKAKQPHKDFPDNTAQNAPDAAEVADRQTQSAPLGLQGDTSKKKNKKKESTTTGEKTRMSDKKKPDQPQQPEAPAQPTPIPAVPGAPAASPAPAPNPAPAQNPPPQQ